MTDPAWPDTLVTAAPKDGPGLPADRPRQPASASSAPLQVGRAWETSTSPLYRDSVQPGAAGTGPSPRS